MDSDKENIEDDIHCDAIPFVPEIQPKIIDYNKKLFKHFFPFDKNVRLYKLQLSNIGRYSICTPYVAQYITGLIKLYFKDWKTLVITDGNGNMGGNTISFAKSFGHVNSVEIIPLHCDILRNNITEYGLIDKVTIICDDYFNVMDKLEQDVIYFDPPWGGPEYKQNKLMDLYMNNISMVRIINHLKPRAKMIIMRVPYNYNLHEFTMKIKYDKIDLYKMVQKNKVKFIVIVLMRK